MKVKVLYFSVIKDRLKKSSETVELKEGSTVSDLLNTIKTHHPEIEETLKNIMVAVNEEYASTETPLKEGDTVALIPPVSGG
ncbi:molybdopterin converting factor subunit 1 [Persephonella sp.]